jgi:tetratricopeptide (TPR) repeat protein
MAITLTGLRIFISSPGGLDGERAALRDSILNFNENFAYDESVTFIPTGWELVPGSVVRPQEKINAEVCKADFMVLLLWDRWGSPTGSEEAFSSGTQEEFEIALQCIGNPKAPMRDMLVLFKAVGEHQLRDPGPQLSRVLNFKTKLEQSKQLLFHTVDTLEDIKRHLEQNLRNWMRLRGEKEAKEISIPSTKESIHSFDPLPAQELLKKANELESNGMITQAEAALAQAISSDDPESLLQYARFMRRTGRLDGSFLVNKKLLSLPRFIASDDPAIIAQRAEVLANMGLIRRKQGLFQDSRMLLQEAVQTARTSGPLGRKVLGYALDNLGLTLIRLGDLPGSRGIHEEALQVRRTAGDRQGEAYSLINLSRLAKHVDDLPGAAKQAREALSLLQSENDEPGIANASSLLGEILVAQGSHGEAKACFEQTLGINEKRRNSDGISVVSVQLGRLSLESGDFESANKFARRSKEVSSQSSNQEGIAVSLRLLGQIKYREGNLNQSLDYLMQAISIFMKMGDLVREADSRFDAAKTLIGLGQRPKAENELVQAMKAATNVKSNNLIEKIKCYEQEITKSASS